MRKSAMTRMRNERAGRTIFVPPLPELIRHWQVLGYEIDSDRPPMTRRKPKACGCRDLPTEGRAHDWGKPNRWEQRAPVDVHKASGRR